MMAVSVNKKTKLSFPVKKFTLGILITLLLFSSGISISWAFMLDKIFPQVSVAGINLSFLNKTQSKQKIDARLNQRLNQTLTLNYQPGTASQSPQTFEIKLNEDSVNLETDRAINEAFVYGHQKLYTKSVDIPIKINLNSTLASQIEKIAQSVNVQPIDSGLKVTDQEITVTPSQDGLSLDSDKLKEQITEFINTGKLADSKLPVKVAPPKLSYNAGLQIKKRLDQIKLTPLSLIAPEQTFTLDLSQILSLIDLENTQSSVVQTSIFGNNINIGAVEVGSTEYVDTKLTLNEDRLDKYLDSLKVQIDRKMQEPLFALEQTSDPAKPKIKEFKPPSEGRSLNKALAAEKISQALLTQNQTTVKLPVQIVEPKNKLTNDLGIKELIGRGVSNFAGSIPNRIFNIGLAASRINGVLIPPGEEFSFVNTVGDITAQTGYKQAYVIKSGRTVLDDGGGVCQVSTTVFRAALNSGLPITSRTAHAYRVGYYEQGFPPGLDATIYYPSVDFKFKNDTGKHILIQSYTDGLNLFVDLYGTSDGRVATLTRPVVTNVTPAPAPLYQDDPALPAGTVKQVDFAAAGANVIFSRTVERSGQVIIKDSFRSNFRPWQAVFLRGTKTG